jgi:hypothetical protein
MAENDKINQAGINIQNVGQGVVFKVGGNIEIRNTVSFATADRKQKFKAQVDEISAALREVGAHIRADESLAADQKEHVADEIQRRLTALEEAQKAAEVLPANEPASPEVATKINAALDTTDGIVKTLQNLTQKTVGVAESVATFATTYGPLILKARHLLGLP